ncbi:MAG TPA: glycosyl hydrolase family 65 protein, partial [Brevefilum sp.]
MTSYGYFDDEHREYVITNPKTPVKWINYIGTLAFGGFVDQTGGMLICKQDPALNRITKYLTQGPPSEFRGTTLYVRTPGDQGGYDVFSPFPVPTGTSQDRYECHVGLGYSDFISETKNLRMHVRVFVPINESLLIQEITITNLGKAVQSVDLIPVVEYTHPDALKQLTNADWVPQTMQSYLHQGDDGLLMLSQCPFMNKERQRNYFTANIPVASFETDRACFLGENGYGSWASPGSLQQEELSNTLALRGDNIAALMLHLGPIPAGESQKAIVLLGQASDIDKAMPLIRHFRDPVHVEEAFETLNAFWESALDVTQVQTPDPNLDRMLNIHNPRQCIITMNWSRYLSLYQLGFGARGMGFRDSSQDVMGAVSLLSEPAKSLLVKLLHVQKMDGSAMHQFNPLSMVANMGDSAAEEDRPKFYSDDHLWGVLAVAEYLKETGDFAFLAQEIPFYEKDRHENPLESGTVWEHLSRAIQFTHDHTGQHGLPLLGFADWNDTVNLPEGAESLFTAHLYGWALKEMIALGEMIGEADHVETFTAYYQEMSDVVNAEAWDGHWYVRYYDHHGQPLGSRSNEQGQIYTNAQSWAVLSGFAPPERALSALHAVYERLNTSRGIKLSTPGYNGFDPEKGGVTTYPPGAKENGGIFLHANPWVMIAETKLGSGDRSYQYYCQINPAGMNDRIDEFECEPYVYPQNILGDEHPQFGLARNSWLTGTASWTYQAGLKYILGIRPEYDGLKVDPCIPASWDGFEVSRKFRGATYHIRVSNPDGVCKGVQSVLVDDQPYDGT